jgi:hypothetical protein
MQTAMHARSYSLGLYMSLYTLEWSWWNLPTLFEARVWIINGATWA